MGLATLVGTMRRKGLISGVFDTGLNSLPIVGAAKNVFEVARGRDFFPDRPARGASTSSAARRPEAPISRP